MTRRLRALVALGYSQNHLCSLSGLSPSTMSHLIRGSIDRTSRTVAEQVVALYDTISMTPGPSDEARNRARSSGWAPPLAWDDDEIDNPSATPHMGSRKRVPRHIEYQELKQLGFTDIEILHRWNIHPQSLMRMLRRAGITPSQELARIMEHRLFWVAS